MSPRVMWTHVQHATCHLDLCFSQTLCSHYNMTCVTHLLGRVSSLPFCVSFPPWHMLVWPNSGWSTWDTGISRLRECWLWSLIIFLIQRSLLSAVFIPHEVFTPQKYVHSSTRGSAEGGYPLCGVRGVHPPGWGVWGQAGPQRGFGGEAPEAKIAL
jgi:hypothetical protein